MKRISLVLVAAAVACWAAPGGGAATFKGAVVGRDATRGAIAVASARGAVHTIRVAKLRNLGSRVSVLATRRPDGTFRARRVSVSGRTGRARIHGVVVRRAAGKAFLSAGGTVLAVRGARAARPGRVVTVDVSIHRDGLRSARIIQAGTAALIEVEGTIASLSPLKIALEHGGATIQLTVPAALTLPTGLAVGDEVEAIVSFADGVYTLVTLEGDDEAQQGDDDNRGEVEVRGTVTAVGGGSLTVKPREGNPVIFTVPAGFDLTGIAVGSKVEAEGVRHGDTLTLTKLKREDDEGDDDHGGHGGGGDDDHHGGGGGGDDD